MAETTKKERAPRKPSAAKSKTEAKAMEKVAPKVARKTTIRRKAAPVAGIPVSHEEIAVLAHRFWMERGGAHGHHEEDWLRAERELLQKAS